MASRIVGVDGGSPAARAGLKPGMLLEKINGHEIKDVLDYRYWSEEPKLLLELRDERGRNVRKRVKKPEGPVIGAIISGRSRSANPSRRFSASTVSSNRG